MMSKWNCLRFVSENDSFQWFRVDSFFWETILYTRCTFRFKTLQDVFIHLELCYTLHERSFSKIHNRGTLRFEAHYRFWKIWKVLKDMFKIMYNKIHPSHISSLTNAALFYMEWVTLQGLTCWDRMTSWMSITSNSKYSMRRNTKHEG